MKHQENRAPIELSSTGIKRIATNAVLPEQSGDVTVATSIVLSNTDKVNNKVQFKTSKALFEGQGDTAKQQNEANVSEAKCPNRDTRSRTSKMPREQKVQSHV